MPLNEPAARRPLPLEGIRIIELTSAWAGPFACQLMGDLGAEVIRLENIHIWQPVTRSFTARPSKEMLWAQTAWSGGYPDMEPGERPWSRSPGYINLFRNKYAVTVELRKPLGKEMLARLVAKSDVFYENNATDLMEKLGITYEWLSSVNPRIIFIRAPAFGNDGERRDIRAYGTQVEALMGHTLLRGYPDLDPTSTATIFTSDIYAGLTGAFTVLAALLARERTGTGQQIEVAQAECSMAILAEAFLDYSMNGRVASTVGNRSIHGAVQGVYRCAGPDDWVAITIANDEQWAAFTKLIGREDLAAAFSPGAASPANSNPPTGFEGRLGQAPLENPDADRLKGTTDRPSLPGSGERGRGSECRFSTAPSRLQYHDEIDAVISEWTARHDKRAIAGLLQVHGIAAGPVMSAKDVYEDPHVAERRFHQVITHPATGTYPWPTTPFQLSETPLTIRRVPRDLGEDNEYVYKELLGVSDEEYDALIADGHVGTEFDEGL